MDLSLHRNPVSVKLSKCNQQDKHKKLFLSKGKQINITIILSLGVDKWKNDGGADGTVIKETESTLEHLKGKWAFGGNKALKWEDDDVM